MYDFQLLLPIVSEATHVYVHMLIRDSFQEKKMWDETENRSDFVLYNSFVQTSMLIQFLVGFYILFGFCSEFKGGSEC